MTHQNHQTNGASLEDCHTNFFALTDLCGIKWRKFVNSERVNASSDPLDDPILRSYSRCMQADILCVWRRIPSTKQDNSDLNPIFEISTSKVHPPLSLAAAKELWIFWYGEEPDLSELVDAELLKVAANQALWNGTWERGLTYECRSLLFKALHNLMERFVLTKDIVRFGKWFVQPCTSNDRLFGRSSQHLSFSFTFFVHGDTVCASIDLREHPAVRPLSKEHLTEAAAAFAAASNSQTLSQSHEHSNATNLLDDVASPHNSNNGGAAGDGVTNSNSTNASATPKPRRVILAPFGMAATLTGNSFKATDPMAEKILEDWASFFPLCNKENSDVPPVVEVVSGGHKMYHPSIYVLVTDLDDMEEMEAAALQKGSLGTTSSAEAAALTAISSANTNEYAANSRKPTPTHQPASLQQQQQQQMHTVTTVTTVATSSSQANSSGGTNGISSSNSSIAMVEQHLHELTARAQPYYDTTASSFTGNTTNTHASPQAATEMPERVWQDCITNTLHVTYAASVASTATGTGGATTAQITCSSLSTTTSGGVTATTATGSGTVGGGEDCNSTSSNSGNNGNSDNNAGGGGSSGVCSAMNTQIASTNASDANGMEAKLRAQQLQFWGFVDPMEKAPCTCTKLSSSPSTLSFLTHTTSSSKKTAASTTSLSMTSPIYSVSGPATSVRLSNSMMMALGGKLHPTGSPGCGGGSSSSSTSNSTSNSHQQQLQQQQQHQQYRIATPSSLFSPPSTATATATASSPATVYHSNAKSTTTTRTKVCIPFHRRQQYDFNSDNNTTGGSNYSNAYIRCRSESVGGGGGSGGVCFDVGDGAVDTVDAAAAAASNGITTMHYQTSDTIPKQRTLNPASMTPHDTPHGGASTYSRNSVGDLMPVPSVGSPGTPAHSPHPNSTLSQPTSVPPADQLSTMSPRAPPSVPNLQQPPTPIDHLLDKNTPAPTPTDQHDNKSITTSPYVRPTPSVEPPPSVEAGNGGMTGVGPNGPGSVPQPPSVGRCTPTIGGQQQQQQQQQQGTHSAQSQAQMLGTTGTTGPQCGSISIKKFELQQPSLTTLSADQIKTEPGYGSTPVSGSGSRNGLPVASMPSGMSAADAINDYWKSFKMPEIKVKDIDSFANDDCSKYNVLYDFTFQNAWANHPMKRFKLNEVTKPFRSMCTKNLYEGHTHSKPLMPSPGSVYGSQLLSIDASLNSLSGSVMNAASVGGSSSGGLVGIAAHCGNVPNIKEENVGSDGNANAGGYFRGLDIQTTDALQGTASPCKDGKSSASGNLYTAEGLNPTMNDLEQLFETSNDGCGSVQIHTPPDSNNPSNGSTATTTIDDLKRSTAVAAAVNASAVAIAALQNCTNTANAANTIGNNGSSNGGGTGGPSMIQAEDLTKMFPTPPSHEQHHPNSSPCQMDIQMTDLSVITAATTMTSSLDTGMGGMIKIKQEYFAELGSPVEEPIEDWSYVYRPPKRAKFVGSSKYAPLTNLPSQTLPPLVLPANCTYKPSWTTQKSRAVVAAQAAAAQQQQQQQLQQQQQQLQQQHQQLHELLSAAPRTPLQQPRTPLGPMPSPMHSNTVPTPLSSGGGGAGGGNNLLLNQLNCPQAALTNTPGSTSMQQMMQRAGMSPISPSPASVVPFPMMQPQRHPPPPYEMAVASPATSTSSYLNKQYHSQEHPPTPQSVGMPSTHLPRPLSAAGNLPSTGVASGAVMARELPEVSSLIVNILLYDTALNVFRDHNFDSSTVCVCNADSQKVGNIRGADSGVYVPLPGGSFNPLPPSTTASGNTSAGGNSGSGGGAAGGNMRLLSAFGGGSALDSPASLPGTSGHTGSGSSSSSNTPASNQHITGYVDDDPVDCTCGFSAVVNRRLAFRAGLFYEDELEITGVAEDPARYKKQSLPSLIANLAAALTPAATKLASSLPIKGANVLVPAQADKANHAQPDAQALQNAHIIFDLLLEQCSIIQTSSSSIHRALQRHRHRLARQSRQPQSVAAISNVLEFVDANDVMCLALEQARLAFESNRMDVSEFSSQNQLSPFDPNRPGAAKGKHQLFGSRLTVHKWPYIPVGFSRSNKEIVRTMNFIQPMLQNAFHSKSRSAAGSKDATYTVSGPLTWRQFHRLAGRASGQCEPQPIPSVIVGHDKDWVSVAPLAIHYWDKLLLEPYAYARDIVYLVVCPETEFVVQNTRTYFRELSSTYEMCKLGRHTPIRGWDGLLTVGPRSPTDKTPNNTPLDDWLRSLDNSALAEKIRLYASAFHNQIAPYLNRVPGDKTLLNPPENSSCQPGAGRERGTTSPMGSMSSMHSSMSGVEQDKTHISPKIEGMDQQQQQLQQQQQQQLQHQQQQQQQQQQSSAESVDMKPDIKSDTKPPIVLSDPLGMGETMEDINPPAIVLYVVEPFTFGSDSPELERLACIALLRCYAELLKSIPDSVRANINIQIISLESIVELGRSRTRKRFSDEIRCLALNIFSQCRRHLVHTQAVKSLTGFGTAANMEAFLKSKDEKNRQPYKMYTPPYVLAPMHEKNDKTDFSRQSSSMRALNEQKYSVMYCNYCLSEDQSWLLATVTDDRGEMFEKIVINIDVPNRARRRKAPARRVGLKKLMDFIMGLISQTAHHWRLVIGRIGRIGHSELKSWSSLLSKQNLQKASKQLKDICKQCSFMYPPAILSACLVTLEPDAKLRVMPDQFTPDERFSQISMQNPLSTPQDVTCTHILVFPTSAVCLSFTRQFQNEPQVDLENDIIFDDDDENGDFTDAEFMGDLLDWDRQPGRLSNHCSPDRMEDNRSWPSAGGNNFTSTQQQDVEEVGSINQQPLAVGYMVSTAPTGRMPSWFWAACPHLEDVCPVFLKTALHLHVPNIQTADDILNSTNAHSSAIDHPLDSSLTADVLRFVLEGYNALSWLALDSNTHDRLSCLPINVQMLMDLYYLTAAIM